ncbi:MAG: N-acetylglucosamine-6-phosphate deacetylase [Verrucomicrobiota bacterium]
MSRGAFDIQVNGYAGADFNRDGLAGADLEQACSHLERDGNEGILATIITDDLPKMENRLARLTALREQNTIIRNMIRGFHIEGPFISPEPGYVGAHPAAAVQPASVDAMQRLLDAAGGLTRLVTLAPEHDSGFKVIRKLHANGITVAAGHCDPDLDTLKGAIDAGLSLFTHLGNGCPMQMHRHDNIIQRVLSLSPALWISFIADGAHVPWPALKNYLTCAGLNRSIITTDAISAARLGPGRYTLGDREVDVGEDAVVWAPDRSHFVGSAGTMPQVIARIRSELGLADEDIHALTSTNPRKAVGIE